MATKKKVVKKPMTTKKNQSKPKPLPKNQPFSNLDWQGGFAGKKGVSGKMGIAQPIPKKVNRNTVRKAANQAFKGY